MADLAPEQYEVIGAKKSYRLAQRPGSYVVLEHVRPVIKPRSTATASSSTSSTSATPTTSTAISLVYDDYVSTTGMAAAPGGPLSTSVGYSCGVTSFLFRPDVIVNLCYIDRPSFFTGTV